jgi:hypothetical protein
MVSIMSTSCLSCLAALFNTPAIISLVSRKSNTVDGPAFTQDSSCTAKIIKKLA